MKNEIWKEICGLEGKYKVSNTGRVWSVKTNRERKLVKDKMGIFKFILQKMGKICGPRCIGLWLKHLFQTLTYVQS